MGQAERGSAVAGEFSRSWSSMLDAPGWWPGASQIECTRLMRGAGSSADAILSEDFVTALGSSLRKWRAFRGARFDSERLRASLEALAPLLRRWEGVSILTLRPEDMEDLFELFDAVREIKPTTRKWVVASKLLYHVLPNLIVPMDNQLTAPFLGRGSLPATFEASFLVESCSAFVGLARDRSHGIGALRVRAASREVPYPVEGAALMDCRVGLARVLDLAIAGFVREHGRTALRTL